jgi:hypothetical protein
VTVRNAVSFPTFLMSITAERAQMHNTPDHDCSWSALDGLTWIGLACAVVLKQWGPRTGTGGMRLASTRDVATSLWDIGIR